MLREAGELRHAGSDTDGLQRLNDRGDMRATHRIIVAKDHHVNRAFQRLTMVSRPFLRATMIARGRVPVLAQYLDILGLQA